MRIYYTHIQLVEAMHAPHFLLIFKISEVRHLDVSAFSGRREFRKAVMHLDLRSSFEWKAKQHRRHFALQRVEVAS